MPISRLKSPLNNSEFSRFAAGFMRATSWNFSKQEMLSFIQQLLELGITTMDHADIYGGLFTQENCETLFGRALAIKPELRDKMELISKCGIVPDTPEVNAPSIKHYNLSKKYIINSVDQSLARLQTEHLDVLLLHRPSPLMQADEVAEAMTLLKSSKKVESFGVSNFLPSQFDLLQSRLDFPLICNQIEISPLQLTNIENGCLDHLQQHRVFAMAWSCLAGGEIFSSEQGAAARARVELTRIADSYELDVSSIIYAWILNLPANIMPVLGTGNIQRIHTSIKAEKITLSKEDWFSVLQAVAGRAVA